MALYENLGKCEGCVYCQSVMICLSRDGSMELYQKCFNSKFNKKTDEAWERPTAGCPNAWSYCLGRKGYEE